MAKQNVLVMGIPGRYIFTEEEVRAMPVLSTDKWERRDTGDPRILVESFQKRNGHLSIHVAWNVRIDGTGEWATGWTYSSERVEVSPEGKRSLRTHR